MASLGGKITRIIILGLTVLGAGSIWGVSRFAPKKLSICEVQGNGEISSFVGKKVIIRGIVSADLDRSIPAGFTLADWNCPVEDGSSKGIFVELDHLGDVVHLGDEIRVKGLVQEIGGETRIKGDPSEMAILSLGNEIPPGINLVEELLLNPDTYRYENWEGMLVSFPEGELLSGFFDADLPRVLPLYDLDPTLQMVCFQNQSIALQISTSEDLKALGNIANGDLLQNPLGILRQNTSGYLLELIAGQDIRVVGRESYPELVDERLSPEWVSEPTRHLIRSGTPSVFLNGTPAGTLIPSPTIIPSLTYYRVHMLISEFYPNPAEKEPDGEWIEIYNPEPYAQPLSGIKLGDETSQAGKEGMLRFPDGYYLESQAVLVVAHRAKAFSKEFGFLPDFEMEDSDARIPDLLPFQDWGRSEIQFSNSGDEVLLLDPWNEVIDLLVYGNSTAAGFSSPPPAPKEGHSLERYPPETDRDRGEDWREREEPSPGRLDRSPPTQAASSTPQPTATLTPSFTVLPSETTSSTPTKTTPTRDVVTLTPSPEVILSPTPSLTITVIAPSTPSMTPTQTPTPLPSWTVTSTSGSLPSPSITGGVPMTGTPPMTFTSTATVISLPGPTSTGTEEVPSTPLPSDTPPRTPTVTTTAADLEDQTILLNEVHADPDLILGDANNDGQVHSDDDEFLEFLNIGEVDLDLSGWSIADSLKIRYHIPEGTVLKAGCGIVIFGGGDPQGDFGGSLVFSTGSLGLNNAGDIISLTDSGGVERIFYRYGSEGGENQSLTRSPDRWGDLPLVLHGEAEGSNGEPYSPGTRLDGSVFGDCP